MYKVIKVLNNNTILVDDNNKEGVVISKGIGFGKKNGEEIEIPKNAKLYIMQKSSRSHYLTTQLSEIEAVYIEIAHEILKYAQDKYGLIGEGLLTPVALNLYFSVKFHDEMDVDSDMSDYRFNDFSLLYPMEHDIALKAKEIIKKYTSVTIDDNQIKHIAIHLNSDFFHSHIDISDSIYQIINDAILEIKRELNISIDTHSYSFIRMLRHIRFSIADTQRKLLNLNKITEKEYSYAYQKAEQLINQLSQATKTSISENEIGYYAIYIEELIINSDEQI